MSLLLKKKILYNYYETLEVQILYIIYTNKFYSIALEKI